LARIKFDAKTRPEPELRLCKNKRDEAVGVAAPS